MKESIADDIETLVQFVFHSYDSEFGARESDKEAAERVEAYLATLRK